jgi:indolepyruvate ferredoxin oxidoreductase beta subunit
VADRVAAEFPVPLHRTLGEAVARLIDYQDRAYAEQFLARVRRVHALDGEGRLTEVFARRLAVWMSYEDVIRVADLKTRRSRFDRIRRESGAAPGSVMVVTDYFKPDLDELYGILPAGIAAPIARWAERRWPHGRPTPGQHVKTTTVLGFLRVWVLGRLRFLRPRSLRFQRESAPGRGFPPGPSRPHTWRCILIVSSWKLESSRTTQDCPVSLSKKVNGGTPILPPR